MALTLRWTAFAVSALTSTFAAWLFIMLARADGWTSLDSARLVLSTLCVFWLTWGTMSGLIGLLPMRLSIPERHGPRHPDRVRRTALLMPIYHEDPPSTFARVAAMSARLTAIDAHRDIDIFILSDSQSLDAASREALWLERLLTDCEAREQIFYEESRENMYLQWGLVLLCRRQDAGAAWRPGAQDRSARAPRERSIATRTGRRERGLGARRSFQTAGIRACPLRRRGALYRRRGREDAARSLLRPPGIPPA